MQCSSCGVENPASAKFCFACGVSTSIPPKPIACPACSHENPRAAKFCIECGTTLIAAVASPAPGIAAPFAPFAGTNETTAFGATAGSAATPSTTVSAAARQRGAAQPNPSGPTATGAVPTRNTAAATPEELPPETRHVNMEWKVALLVLLAALGLARWLWSMQNETHQAEVAMSSALQKGGKAAPASVNTLSPQPTSTTSYGLAEPTPPGSQGEQAAAAASIAVSQPAVDTATVDPLTVEAPPVADPKPKKTKKRSNPVPMKGEPPIPQRHLAEVELTAADRVLEPPRTVPNIRAKVAECRQLTLFDRERCMWSICNGQWGKDGCPSYER